MTKKIFTVLAVMLIAVSLFASTDTESYADLIPPGFIVINSSAISSIPFIINVDSIAMVVPVKPLGKDTWKAKIFVSYGLGKGGSAYSTETSSFITTESYSEVIQMICSAQKEY